jgi:hypothetical protein
MNMKRSPLHISLVLVTLASACGTEIRNVEDGDQAQSEGEIPTRQAEPVVNPNLPQASSQEVAVDEELAAAEVTDSVDEGISSIADVSDQQAGVLGLVPSRSINLQRNCSEVEGAAKVEMTMNFLREWNHDGPVRVASQKITDSGLLTRLWSHPSHSIACDEEKKRADVKLEELEGTKVQIDLARNRSKEASYQNKRNGKSFARSMKLEVVGKRQVSWDKVEISEDSYVASKTISSAVNRKLQVQNKAGEERVIERRITISAENPLKVEVTRELETGVALKKVIKSGTIEAERADKGKIITRFNEVVHTQVGRCMADSGTISGEIYPAEATEPSLTFVITFSEGTKRIQFSNGKEAEYTPEGCELETLDPMSAE